MHLNVEKIRTLVADAIKRGEEKNNGMPTIHIANVMLPAAGRAFINDANPLTEEGYNRIPTEIVRPRAIYDGMRSDYHYRTKEVFNSLYIIKEMIYSIGHSEYGTNLYEFLPLLENGQKCFFNVSAEGIVPMRQLLGDHLMTAYTKVEENYRETNLKRKFSAHSNAYQLIRPRREFGRAELTLLNDPAWIEAHIDLVIPFNGHSTQANAVAVTMLEKVEELKIERFSLTS